MGIVRFALKYPHTFYVVAALILFLGVTAAVEMPTDIFERPMKHPWQQPTGSEPKLATITVSGRDG